MSAVSGDREETTRTYNPVFLNQIGQDTIQDIVNKAQDIFQVSRS